MSEISSGEIRSMEARKAYDLLTRSLIWRGEYNEEHNEAFTLEIPTPSYGDGFITTYELDDYVLHQPIKEHQRKNLHRRLLLAGHGIIKIAFNSEAKRYSQSTLFTFFNPKTLAYLGERRIKEGVEEEYMQLDPTSIAIKRDVCKIAAENARVYDEEDSIHQNIESLPPVVELVNALWTDL